VSLLGDAGNGRRFGFNDQGQVAFEAFFADGTSRVFVSNLVATAPEPILRGDVNRNDTVDFADVPAFISVLSGGGFQAEALQPCQQQIKPQFVASTQWYSL